MVQGILMVTDAEFLAGLQRCKALGALAMVHGENGDAVAEGQRFVFEELGVTGPEGHCLSRPAALEAEATGRAIRLAAHVGTPLYVVHVMSEGALDEVRAGLFFILVLVGCLCVHVAAPLYGVRTASAGAPDGVRLRCRCRFAHAARACQDSERSDEHFMQRVGVTRRAPERPS